MRRVHVVATILGLVFLLPGLVSCSILSPTPTASFSVLSWEQTNYTLEADFEILGWEQSFYSSLGTYGLVQINYRIENTGSMNIRYYKIWFEVECADGSSYREWTNGLDIRRHTYETDSTYVDTSDKRAISVKVDGYELSPPIGEEPRGLVWIDYRMTNTGQVSIDYYKAWFEVKCASGTSYRDWTNGALIDKGQSETGIVFVETGAYSEAISVSVVDYELTHHSIWK
ncbi:hypothetical protein KAH43_00695 [Candidatus Bipolaricaulota bacterium]|nr:hypothetical protein [Candidatus Bipolaricaulota bacterium]